MRTMLVEANHIRHLRRSAHSHSRTPGFLFLSPEWPSCVRHMTERKEKLAKRTSQNLSLRGCSKMRPVACEYKGQFLCTGQYVVARTMRAKSNDEFVRAMRKLLARVVSRLLPRLCGRSKRQRTSPPLLELTSAPAPAGCPANSNLPASSLPPSSPKSRGAIKRRPF